jgi:hypothetical protein
MLSASTTTRSFYIALIALAVFIRIYNLSWGLPYPFHPDERNMADGIVRLECHDVIGTGIDGLRNCLNPHFFAYGQAPLYIGYAFIQAWHALIGTIGKPVAFYEATMSLRVQSVLYSLGALYFAIRLLERVVISLNSKKADVSVTSVRMFGLLAFTLQPYTIQFSHFGTTESLLMMMYLAIVWLCCLLYQQFTLKRVMYLGIVLGVSAGVKVSSLSFAGLPSLVILYKIWTTNKSSHMKQIQKSARYAIVAVIFASIAFVITSPHYVLSYTDFINSMNYEIGVGSGSIRVFYTRQFEDTIPYIYQFLKIFPYSHGQLQLVLFILAFFLLPWTNPYANILRLAFLIFFIPTGMVYTKWARFSAPLMPVMSLCAYTYAVYLLSVFKRNNLLAGLVACIMGLSLLPGLGYFSIYATPDVRFKASEWMDSHVPPDSHVLIESGNVVNLPIYERHARMPNGGSYVVHVQDIYNLDASEELRNQLLQEKDRADYIIIASRRVFANHTCLWPSQSIFESALSQKLALVSARYPGWCEHKHDLYPHAQAFYEDLFSGKTYQLVQTFSSPPRIQLWDKNVVQFEDEAAEEAWTVFDHPTIRIYKKIDTPLQVN